MSCGSGASKSSDIQILPLRRPGLRDTRIGTSFAIGLPFFAMMISSPAAAWSTRADNWVFASYRFNVMTTTLPSSAQLVKLVNTQPGRRGYRIRGLCLAS